MVIRYYGVKASTGFLGKEDIIIILGDFGVGFFDGKQWPEEMFYDYLAEQDYTVLFIDGNHENFNMLKSYPIEAWNGGKAQFIRKNVIHLMRGELYGIEGKNTFASAEDSPWTKTTVSPERHGGRKKCQMMKNTKMP